MVFNECLLLAFKHHLPTYQLLYSKNGHKLKNANVLDIVIGAPQLVGVLCAQFIVYIIL